MVSVLDSSGLGSIPGSLYSQEPGKIPGCQLDFPRLISPRGMLPLAPSSGPTAQITPIKNKIPAAKIFNCISGS